MNADKWILKSKTILGILGTTLALWAPQLGLDFTADNATVFTESWNEIVASIFAIFAVYGRVVAEGKVVLKK